MATYTVHLPPAGQSDPATLERARFIIEGASVLALVFPALWLLFYRLWYALVAYLLLVAAIAILARMTNSAAPALLSAFPALYLFLEGRQLLRARLERAGWRFAGVVEASDVVEAEHRFFDSHPPTQPVRKPAPEMSAPAVSTPTRAEPSIGIFGP